MGCGEACQIAQYYAVKEVLGDKFNALFSADSKTPLQIGRQNTNPCSKFRKYLMIKNAGKSPKQIQAGDHVYVTNDQRYLSKHILGALEGFNVICIEGNIDEPKFTGLGLPAKGVSLKEINAILIDGFNSDPSNLEFLSSKTKELFKATMSSSEENKKLKTTEEEFYKNEGGQVTIISELDVKFLEELSESTTENGKMLLQNRQVRVQTRN